MSREKFRPRINDILEDRLALSHATLPSAHVMTIAAAPRLGALGDSYTDEYRFYPPDRSRARNWVELLAADRKVDFGPFLSRTAGAGTHRGFANDWAESGATSDDMVSRQLPGLSDEVRQGRVNLAFLFIGGNDYLDDLEGLLTSTETPDQAISGLARVEARAEANVTSAVTTLIAANPNARVVLANLPDLRQDPDVRAAANFPTIRPVVDALGSSIARFNARLATLADQDPGRVAIADLNGLFARFDAQGGASGMAPFGNTAIDVRNPGDGYRHLFLADGLHAGTVGQGMIADLFVRTADSAFNLGVRPLSTSEILRAARHLPAR